MTMMYRALGVLVLGVALSFAGTRRAGAQLPSADELLKKCLGSYDAAKTFQGDMKITKLTSSGRTSVSLQIKAENDATGMIARSSLTLVSNIQCESGVSAQSVQMIEDGTTQFVVYPDQKQYATGPHASDRISGLFRKSLTNAEHLGGRVSTEVRQMSARPTYVLKSKLADGFAQILIDKATFHLQSIHVERGKAAAREVSDLTVSNQVFDQQIPAEAFVWKAPAGFTKAAGSGTDSP
jgi:outer membrane lipoprotein-sorting protein